MKQFDDRPDVLIQTFRPTVIQSASEPKNPQVEPPTASGQYYKRDIRKIMDIDTTEPGTEFGVGGFCEIVIIPDRPLSLRIDRSSRAITLTDPVRIIGNIDRIWLQRWYNTDEMGQVRVEIMTPPKGIQVERIDPFLLHREAFTPAGPASGTLWAAGADDVAIMVSVTLPDQAGCTEHFIYDLSIVRSNDQNGLFDGTITNSRLSTEVIYGVQIYPNEGAMVTNLFSDWQDVPSPVYKKTFPIPLKVANTYAIKVVGSVGAANSYLLYNLNVGNSY